MAAARAVTTSMTSGASSAKPAASSTPAASEPAAKPEASALDAVLDSEEPSGALFPASADDKKEPEADKAEKGDDDKPKTAEEATKAFIRLGKRETKFKREKKEWKESVASKEAEFAKAKNEIISDTNRLNALQRQISEKHAWVAHGQQAWDNDDRVGFAKAIEKMAKGSSLAQITRWLAEAGDKPKAPAAAQPSAEEQSWRTEKAEWERQRAAEAAKGDTAKKQKDEAKQREEAKGRVAEAFAKHPFLANPDDPKKPDPDALDEAFEKIRGAMKHRKPGETAKQVATRVLDELHARDVRKLKRLGLEPKTQTKQTKAEKKTEESTKPGQRLPEPPASNRDSKAPSLDATRAARIAQAKRMTEQQRRGVA